MTEYEDDEIESQHHSIEHNINLETDQFKLDVDVDHNLLFPLIILCAAVGSLFTSYDSEIRCSLGNQKECAKMAVIEPMKSNQ